MKQRIAKTATVAFARTMAKSTILKQKTITYTKTKFVVTKEFMKFVATDPMFQGIGITVGIASGVTGFFALGHQLYFSSSTPFTEEQAIALLNKVNTEHTENLKAIIKNEVDQRLEIWDIDRRERITESENQIKALRNQRNTMIVALCAVVLFAAFGKTKGFEILAERISH